MTLNRAWAKCSVRQLLSGFQEEIVKDLSAESGSRGYQLTPEQREAWEESIVILENALRPACSQVQSIKDWSVLFEYEIPRRGKRPDVIFLGHGFVCVLEMKIGATGFSRADQLQVEDYVKDLKDFHEESRDLMVIPILCSSKATESSIDLLDDNAEKRVQLATKEKLGELCMAIQSKYGNPKLIDSNDWEKSRYQPTPNIIEAALDVYSGHRVRDISHADADNLTKTVDEIRRLISQAREKSERIACFVTGVPGSGKTLAGLSAIHEETVSGDPQSLGVYLSGNGPLVDVLQYALARDIQSREKHKKLTIKDAERRSSTMVQMVHRFISSEIVSEKSPPENVIVFDEAQRAWDSKQMYRKNKIEKSEAELTFEIMGRTEKWAVVVALIGEGQEINTGEAGISEWMDALNNFHDWKVHVSPHVKHTLGSRAIESQSLHLSVGVRAPRGRVLSDWIEAILDGKEVLAREALLRNQDYPIFISRDLNLVKDYLRDRGSVDRRIGLLASSQARRLRTLGIEMSRDFHGGINWPRWFVDDSSDLRSSYFLEVAASEFMCQGLEIDWVGLCWGSDFFFDEKSNSWISQKLRGPKWHKDKDITWAKNRYRVLLSRARYGLIIWVPRYPDYSDEDNEKMDKTYSFLESCGAIPL